MGAWPWPQAGERATLANLVDEKAKAFTRRQGSSYLTRGGPYQNRSTDHSVSKEMQRRAVVTQILIAL